MHSCILLRMSSTSASTYWNCYMLSAIWNCNMLSAMHRHGAIVHHKMNCNPSCDWDNGTESFTGSWIATPVAIGIMGLDHPLAWVTNMMNVAHILIWESNIRKNVNMQDVRHMYVNNVTKSGLQSIVMIFQMIFQFYVKIMMIIIWDGLNLKQVKFVGRKMELFQCNHFN